MEIWLLLTVVGMASSTSIMISLEEKGTEPKVIQEGSSVFLHCHLFPNSSVRCAVTWYFNSSMGKMGSQNLSKQMFPVCNKQDTLALHSVSQNDSGWYSCKVTNEIPLLETKVSGWTRLEVENSLLEITSQTGVTEQVPEEPPFKWSDWWMWITLGATGLVLLILVIVCFVLRRRQLRQKDLHRVYANTHPVTCRKQPSPRVRPPDRPNTLKMDSSYQNLRTPDVGKRYEHSRRLSPRQ